MLTEADQLCRGNTLAKMAGCPGRKLVAAHLQRCKADSAGCGVDQYCIAFPECSDAMQRVLRRHECRRQSAELGEFPGRRHGDEPGCRSLDGGAEAAVRDAPHTLARRQAAAASGTKSHFHNDAGAIRTCMRLSDMVVSVAAVSRGRHILQLRRRSQTQKGA
jgi:hypothetical protein